MYTVVVTVEKYAHFSIPSKILALPFFEVRGRLHLGTLYNYLLFAKAANIVALDPGENRWRVG
jgi:hypothetical protein